MVNYYIAFDLRMSRIWVEVIKVKKSPNSPAECMLAKWLCEELYWDYQTNSITGTRMKLINILDERLGDGGG